MATTSVHLPTALLPPSDASDGGHDGEIVSVEQYLATVYRPDCDYVNGHLGERNLGEFDQSLIQKRLIILFSLKETE